ncbi:MAG: glycosyltransferase family protein [Rhizobiaceae bacterium]
MSAPRVLFYVQHLLGIGHLARASRVAKALTENGFDLTLVTGGAPVSGFPAQGVKRIELPPVVASDQGFGGLAQIDGGPADEAFLNARRGRLLHLFAELRPDIVILEAFPFGRRQMRFELLPLLDAVRSTSPKPLVVSSVRDILQEQTKPGRNEEILCLIQEHFDLVMVHGDPAFAALDETFPFADKIRDRIAYTGLVAGPAPTPSDEVFDVLVSAGGGAAGQGLVRATVEAAKLVSIKLKWGLITGPNLPAADFDAASAAAPLNVSIFRFRPDFPSLLASAELSVSQAGYNTVCDLLHAGCRSLLVPFAAGGETEQTARAERLQALGLANFITEADLTPQTVAAAVDAALAKPKPPANSLDVDGAVRSAEVLRARLMGKA